MNLKLHLGVIVCLAAVGGLLITTFHAVVQEEVIIVNVLPADFSWENAKPIMLELRGIAPNTRVAFWTWEGHGNFGSMGEMKGNTVFLTELSGNYTLSFSAPKKLRIESLSKWDALQLPSSDWRVCGVRTFASLFSGNATGEVKIAFNTGFYNLSLDGNLSLYSTYQQNITGYSRAPNPKIQERYADGVIIRGNGSYTLTVERLPDVEEQNLPPVAALPFEKLVVAEGMNTHLEGIAYDPDGFITNKTWDFGDGKNGSGVSVVHSWQAAGNYTLGFSVQDSNNTVSTTHAWIEVQPAPPQLQVKSEQETSNSFTFTANASKNCQFFWYFGDGDTGYGGTVTHTYSHSGDYTVVVKAISEDGTWNTTSLTVKVENAPPVAAANGPYYGLEGDTVVLNGSMEDEDVSSCNYYWTVGGENYFVNPLNYTFEDDFNGNVAFTVIDNGGLVATDKALVVINNTAPVILSLNASFVVNISYRIAGEKWHDSSLHVYGDGIEVLNLTVYRVPGQPDVEVARGLVLDATKNWSFYADCSFEDDVVNGNENGASPVWLNISFGDSCELLHHTFVWSPGHKDTEWRGFLNPLLHRHPVLLQAYARDRGNDVLAFAWDFGDGNSTVHF
ncbi:MAG: PKD domain-containing protein, partial [Thermoplasmata archaeon]